MDMHIGVVAGALLGAAFSMGLGAIGPACGMGTAAARASESVTRQPSAAGSIIKVMLLGQAVTESPAIFALLIAIMLAFNIYELPATITLVNIAGLISAGLCMGLGALGSGIGAGYANAMACAGVGRSPHIESLALRTMLIGQAVAQSPSVFAMVIGMCMLFIV